MQTAQSVIPTVVLFLRLQPRRDGRVRGAAEATRLLSVLVSSAWLGRVARLVSDESIWCLLKLYESVALKFGLHAWRQTNANDPQR
jgi:hypothetical protein